MLESTVSVASAGACASTAAVLYCAERLPGIKKATNKLHTDRAQALLITTAVVGLASSGVGGWWQDNVTALNDWATSAVGAWTGLVLTGVAGLVCGLYYINDLVTRKVETRTLVLAALLPVLVLSIPGPVGEFLNRALRLISGFLAGLVAQLFGLGG
ncbi:hypothetical protein ACIA6C_28050 [Streptomyces sp. NPDC051578]|uniref:hypothetical protein n=1 Tax=Streptomyces sp. NPDC051578 TaxID=3365662 RepID=UPI0037BC4BB6